MNCWERCQKSPNWRTLGVKSALELVASAISCVLLSAGNHCSRDLTTNKPLWYSRSTYLSPPSLNVEEEQCLKEFYGVPRNLINADWGHLRLPLI